MLPRGRPAGRARVGRAQDRGHRVAGVAVVGLEADVDRRSSRDQRRGRSKVGDSRGSPDRAGSILFVARVEQPDVVEPPRGGRGSRRCPPASGSPVADRRPSETWPLGRRPVRGDRPARAEVVVLRRWTSRRARVGPSRSAVSPPPRRRSPPTRTSGCLGGDRDRAPPAAAARLATEQGRKHRVVPCGDSGLRRGGGRSHRCAGGRGVSSLRDPGRGPAAAPWQSAQVRGMGRCLDRRGSYAELAAQERCQVGVDAYSRSAPLWVLVVVAGHLAGPGGGCRAKACP